MGKRWCERGMVGGNRARVKRKENQVKGKKYILTESGRKG